MSALLWLLIPALVGAGASWLYGLHCGAEAIAARPSAPEVGHG